MILVYDDDVVLRDVAAYSCYQEETGENRLTVRFSNGRMFSTEVKNAWRVIKKEDENGTVVSSVRCSLLARHRPRRVFSLDEYEEGQGDYRIPKLLA